MENEKKEGEEGRGVGEFEVAAAGRRGGERQDLEEMEKRRGRGRKKRTNAIYVQAREMQEHLDDTMGEKKKKRVSFGRRDEGMGVKRTCFTSP